MVSLPTVPHVMENGDMALLGAHCLLLPRSLRDDNGHEHVRCETISNVEDVARI